MNGLGGQGPQSPHTLKSRPMLSWSWSRLHAASWIARLRRRHGLLKQKEVLQNASTGGGRGVEVQTETFQVRTEI